MSKYNKKKADQLGMPYGTACGKLRKQLLWKYVVKAGDNFCYQCGTEILSHDDLSIEHTEPWLDSEDPVDLFFDLEKIQFSHLSCNFGAAKRPTKSCGDKDFYRKGCDCPDCKRNKSASWKKYWESLGKEAQQKRRKDNYEKYGC